MEKEEQKKRLGRYGGERGERSKKQRNLHVSCRQDPSLVKWREEGDRSEKEGRGGQDRTATDIVGSFK